MYESFKFINAIEFSLLTSDIGIFNIYNLNHKLKN